MLVFVPVSTRALYPLGYQGMIQTGLAVVQRSRMIRTGYYAFATLAVILVGCAAGTTESTSGRAPEVMVSTESPSQKLHAIMMRPMANMQMSGNVDRDFATMMADHHQQAVEMAKIEIAAGKNDEIKTMAQAMIASQSKERERLRAIAKSMASQGASQSDASMALHQVMMRPMGNMTMTGDTDRDFARLMAEHHQGAIDMARIEVERGTNVELKAMAQQMIDDQTKERARLLELAG